MQQRMFRKAAIAVALAALAGCTDKPQGLNLTPGPSSTTTPVVFVVNASPDSPNVNANLTQGSTATSAFSLPFGGTVGVFPGALTTGSASLQVDELLPTGAGSTTATQSLISATPVTLADSGVYAYFVAGYNASPSLISVSLNTASPQVLGGEAGIVIVDAANVGDVGGYNVYLTDPTVSLQDAAASIALTSTADAPQMGMIVNGTAFSGQSSEGFVTNVTSAGGYRLRVTAGTVTAAQADGDPSLVLFDSGTTNLLSVPNTGVAVFALLDNTSGVGTSPFALYSTVTGSSYADANTTVANAYFVNASDLGAVDIFSTSISPAIAVNGLALGAQRSICGMTPAAGNLIDFDAAGTNPQVGVTSLETSIAAGQNALFIPTGLANNTDAPEGTLVEAADSRSLATEGRVSFVDAAPSTVQTGVKVYVSTAGSVNDSDIEGGKVAASSEGIDPDTGALVPAAVAFAASAVFADADVLVDTNAAHISSYLQSYLSLPTGSYDIRVTTVVSPTSENIIAEALSVSIGAGQQLSAVLSDGASGAVLTSVNNQSACVP